MQKQKALVTEDSVAGPCMDSGGTMHTGQRVWLLLGIQYQDNIFTGDRKLRAGPTDSMAKYRMDTPQEVLVFLGLLRRWNKKKKKNQQTQRHDCRKAMS